jgi:hypothetical protein
MIHCNSEGRNRSNNHIAYRVRVVKKKSILGKIAEVTKKRESVARVEEDE